MQDSNLFLNLIDQLLQGLENYLPEQSYYFVYSSCVVTLFTITVSAVVSAMFGACGALLALRRNRKGG